MQCCGQASGQNAGGPSHQASHKEQGVELSEGGGIVKGVEMITWLCDFVKMGPASCATMTSAV